MTLGRLASTAAGYLTGKHKASYEPHRDTGDFVTVTNVGKLKLSGRKLQQKVYHDMSGYPGGIHTRSAKALMVTRPEEIIWRAVRLMLPENKYRQARLRRLHLSR